MDTSAFSPDGLRAAAPSVFDLAREAPSLTAMRGRLCALAEQMEFDTFRDYGELKEGSIIRVRDCASAFRSMLRQRSDDRAGFSVAQAIRDVARDVARPDLRPGFYADLYHVLLGLQGLGPGEAPADSAFAVTRLEGREAALERSRQLDALWQAIEARIARYPDGLGEERREPRARRRARIREVLGASEEEWSDWRWQIRNVIRDLPGVAPLLTLPDEMQQALREASERRVPFGITPYYLSLMDDEPSPEDRAVRAQVLPSLDYVRTVGAARAGCAEELDFMRERDTSPIDLITRRYPAIAIFKPYNTCPQICVYCQRNWEIDGVLAPDALAPEEQIEAALSWIREHPAIHEVLLTGGDPLSMTDATVARILDGIAAIPSVERIRIGTRTPVTLPMRFTEVLCDRLASYREAGRREVAVVTHVQSPLEVTPELVVAVDRLRRRGLPVYNQLVFTFFTSRRFEAAALRRLLRRVGIDPYYTFATKGKDETRPYRVPIARLLQDRKEEARLMPGMARTDEAVYNLPGIGKNYLRARQHRNVLSVLPDGARVYEYHPWEKNVSGAGPLESYVSVDIPILDYLKRLEAIGEDVSDYRTIWYYY